MSALESLCQATAVPATSGNSLLTSPGVFQAICTRALGEVVSADGY